MIETTRELVKDVTTDIKQLSTFPLGSASGAAKLTQAKLQRDFQSAAMQFQRVQKDAVAKTRAKLEQDKQKERQMLRSRNSQLLIDTEEADRGAASSQQQQQQAGADAGGVQAESLDLLPEGPSQADLEYQESLITSREAEIREIESGVQELNEIFRDLGNIVQEQGGMIDNIEFNINSIADNTAEPTESWSWRTSTSARRDEGASACCSSLDSSWPSCCSPSSTSRSMPTGNRLVYRGHVCASCSLSVWYVTCNGPFVSQQSMLSCAWSSGM